MKTKIRTHQSQPQNGFQHLHIQILNPRYKGARYLEPMGEITFQKTVGDPNNYGWYGMNFVINTDKVMYIQAMAKLANYIQNNKSGYNAQPKEIIQLIGGEEHVVFDGEFVPVADKGKNIYRVIKEGNLYDKITAPNEIVAQRILDRKNIAGAELKFHKQIIF